jgi:ankyrin repeat protein
MALKISYIKGHLGIVRALLEAWVNIGVIDNNRRMPLYAALLNGYIKVVKLLLENGANIAVADNYR